MKKIAILGFGLEGRALLKFLLRDNFYKDSEITICDRNSHIVDLNKKLTNIFFQTGKDYLKNLEGFDIIFRSPGVSYDLPEIQKALKSGIEISSMTKLFFDRIKKVKCKIIGIAGTKGKGTTATLVYKILKTSGKNVFLAGNIGKPMIELLPQLFKLNSSQNVFIVLEISSFQLIDLNTSPEIATILDVFPDHLDIHKNLKEYVEAEAGIAKWQKNKDKIFFFSDNQYSKLIAQKSKGQKIPVSVENFDLFRQKDLKIRGKHNFKNAVMAASLCLSLDCPKEKIIKTAKSFRGNEHRLEFVRNIKGIQFYNDSASTIAQATVAAITAFEEPKILIAGGQDKNLDYTPLSKEFKNSNTELIILFGKNKHKIKQALSGSKIKIVLVKDLQRAVDLAYQSAKEIQLKEKYSSIFIILSPASTSFDMFLNYAERGKIFKKMVKNLGT